MKWYERTRDILSQLNISHEGLADRIGSSRSTVSGWLSGSREPRLDEIFSIADAIGVTRQWLLFGEDGNGTQPIIRASDSIEVELWEGGENTGTKVTVPVDVGASCKAFKIHSDTGCSDIPKNSLVIVSDKINPVGGDYLLVNQDGQLAVYRLIDLSGRRFLGVDDPRVPLLSLESASAVGVIVFITRNLKN